VENRLRALRSLASLRETPLKTFNRKDHLMPVPSLSLAI